MILKELFNNTYYYFLNTFENKKLEDIKMNLRKQE